MQLTTADIATELNTTTRTLRKFLRADAKERGIATPGKGSRYMIEKKELRGMRTRFTKWNDAQNAKNESNTDSIPTDDDATETD